jgi:RNA polymerase sigma-70 factor, ECF subfamily
LKGEKTLPPTLADSDTTLLEAGLRGDQGALSRLFERHRSSLFAFVSRRLGRRRDWAEDVLQDVYLTICCTTRRYEGRSAVTTWLHGIALNLCRERVRRENHAAPEDRKLEALPDVSLDPLQSLVRAEREAVVRDAVAGLSGMHRRVLRLRDHEGLAYEEIGRTLGVPIGTVRSRVHNARAALARALAARLNSGGRR